MMQKAQPRQLYLKVKSKSGIKKIRNKTCLDLIVTLKTASISWEKSLIRPRSKNVRNWLDFLEK